MSGGEQTGAVGALARFTNGMLLRCGAYDQGTAARSSFWLLFDLSLLLSALHAALVPFWPALRRWGPVTACGRAFGLVEFSVTLVFCITAGVILVNNVGRSSVGNDALIELDLGRGRVVQAKDDAEPSPSTGQAAAALVIALGAMIASLALN